MAKQMTPVEKWTLGKNKITLVGPTNWSARLTGDILNSVLIYTERYPDCGRRVFLDRSKRTAAILAKMDCGKLCSKVRISKTKNELSVSMRSMRKVLLWAFIGELLGQAIDGPQDIDIAAKVFEMITQRKLPMPKGGGKNARKR